MASTTLRLETSTKNELKAFKNFDREPFADVIERLLTMAREEPPLDEGEIKQIEKSLEDLKKGRVLSLEEAEKQWGI